MPNSPPTTPTRAASTTHAPSKDPPTAVVAAVASSSLPPTTAPILSSPNRLMLPPPHPNPATSPALPLSTSAHTTPVCSTTNAISSTTSSPLPAHTSSATTPGPAPLSRNLKLQSQISTLQAQIAATQASLDATLAKLQDQLSATTAVPPAELVSASPSIELDTQAQADAIVKRHIKLLHVYNEIKDVGQGLMGLIADAKGVRLKEVMEDMGVGEKD